MATYPCEIYTGSTPGRRRDIFPRRLKNETVKLTAEIFTEANDEQ